MPVRSVPGNETLDYLLICHDADGRELPEGSGKDLQLLSKVAIGAVNSGRVTDIFLISHGWKGDIPAAIEQYDHWIAAMADCTTDRALIRARLPSFQPLLVGLHWPSLPWGDEELTGAGVSFDPDAVAIGQLVDDYAQRIADTPAAREALVTIFEAALDDMAPPTLDEHLRSAYLVLNREASLSSDDEGAAPGADREPFDPERAYQNERAEASFGAGSEGVLSVLRQLSFWKMKDRARRFGESGAHSLLRSLQEHAARSAPNIRFHLMGHSFGCIVMSAMLTGPDGAEKLLKPIDSLFLVQGALSLWSFCSSIPSVPQRSGYFRRVIADQLVTGPIVVTLSEHDTAVRKYYPLGAGIRGQVQYTLGALPKYGGIGVFGVRGPGVDTQDLDMEDCGYEYDFRPSVVYNLDAGAYIREIQGASGAHNDIAHAEVAHAFWQAVTASQAARDQQRE